ncbi:MAG TPA: hypothetical protein VGQ39_25145 [Pyrinomonadaceae bacterium]|jgi:hypothetical protein|nr:hypothetical protein [Pyrinomonadaceae bacterium]
MNSGRISARTVIALLLLFIFGGACFLNGGISKAASSTNRLLLNAKSGPHMVVLQGSKNGAAGQMPAFFDGELFTVNMKEMPNSDPLIENNPSINEIFASNDLDEEQDFIPVIDAIQGEGFNPLWLQILIVFNPGFTPHQFTSEEEIEAAAAGPNPEITLVETDEVYRCSIVGH